MNDEIELKKGDVIILYKWRAALKRWKKYEQEREIDMNNVYDILGIRKRLYDKISDKSMFMVVVSSDDSFYLVCDIISHELDIHTWCIPKCIVKKVGVNIYEKR